MLREHSSLSALGPRAPLAPCSCALSKLTKLTGSPGRTRAKLHFVVGTLREWGRHCLLLPGEAILTMPMHTGHANYPSAKSALLSPIMDKLLLRENDQLRSGIPRGAGGIRPEAEHHQKTTTSFTKVAWH